MTEFDFSARYHWDGDPNLILIPIGYEEDEDGNEERDLVWMRAEGEDTADVFLVETLTKIE